MGGRSSHHHHHVIMQYVPAPPPPPPPSKKPLHELRAEAWKELDIDNVNNYNIAVAGGTKHGKSTLINALRCVRKGDAGFAQTGEFETTKEIAKYLYPGIPEFEAIKHTVFWDIPGAGTENITADEYSEKQKLYAFHFVIIMTAETLTENDTNFAREVAKYNVPFVFVRSKCDISLRNKAEENEVELSRNVKNDFKQEGEKVFREILLKYMELREAKIYFVSGTVIQNRAGYGKYRLEELELLHVVLEKTMAHCNLPHQQTQAQLVAVANILGLRYKRKDAECIFPDSDVEE